MTILTPIVIDLMNPDPLPIVNAKQGDTGRGIRVTATVDGQVCQFSSEEINIFIRKPDGKLIYNGCEVQSGDVVAMLTNQALAVPGKLQVEMEILSGDEKVSTPIAMIHVLPTNINAEAIESTNEFNRYETIISEVTAAEAERKSAEDARTVAENARKTAEVLRMQAEAVRGEEESERISAETERSEAEALRNQAEGLRKQAEAAREAAEELREAAKAAMQQATEAANAAAEAAGAYVMGDISGKTVDFEEAPERANVESGESTATLFGKIKKWFADLKDAAFATIANNLTTTAKGSVLDARVGPVIDGKFEDIQGELTELNGNMQWKPIGSVTGSTTMNANLMAYQEIMCVVKSGVSLLVYTVCFPTKILSSKESIVLLTGACFKQPYGMSQKTGTVAADTDGVRLNYLYETTVEETPSNTTEKASFSVYGR